MGRWFGVDWTSVFTPSTPVPEIIVRGTVVYLALTVLLHSVHRRQAGGISVTDLLVVVLIAHAAANGMTGGYTAVPDGLFLVGTILFWSWFLDWLGHRVPAVGRLIHPPPLVLVEDGKLLRRNMRHELLTVDELMSQLREQGVDDIAEVAAARMEGDGRISVIRRDPGSDAASHRPVRS